MGLKKLSASDFAHFFCVCKMMRLSRKLKPVSLQGCHMSRAEAKRGAVNDELFSAKCCIAWCQLSLLTGTPLIISASVLHWKRWICSMIHFAILAVSHHCTLPFHSIFFFSFFFFPLICK